MNQISRMQTLDGITLIRGSGKWAEVDSFKTSVLGWDVTQTWVRCHKRQVAPWLWFVMELISQTLKLSHPEIYYEMHLQGASHPPPSEEEKMRQENVNSKVQGELCYISQFKTFPSYQEQSCLDWSELERNWLAGIKITEASGDWLA